MMTLNEMNRCPPIPPSGNCLYRGRGRYGMNGDHSFVNGSFIDSWFVPYDIYGSKLIRTLCTPSISRNK